MNMPRPKPVPILHRTYVKSAQAPPAIGPYSQAVSVGDTLYCSGQIALDPDTGTLENKGTIEAETELVLRNLGAVLQSAGLDYKHVVSCQVYLTDMGDYALMNEVYSQYFSSAQPARQAIGVNELPRGARVLISCIAVR